MFHKNQGRRNASIRKFYLKFIKKAILESMPFIKNLQNLKLKHIKRL